MKTSIFQTILLSFSVLTSLNTSPVVELIDDAILSKI
jgi:hypothetical protein